MNLPAAAESIFHAARDLAPADRESYLDEACRGDARLRAGVAALLAADAEGDFLAGGALELDPATPVEQAGESIGQYRLLEPIGEGGFGTVWRAEQQEPVRRQVALKVLKLGMDTRKVVARFEQERQALAMMSHPHIAKVLDAGATDGGRPFFVMELVDGLPIVDYCDRERLTIRERLELFGQVCLAVQHAHGKGIIHRDLKPSNVLVDTVDDRPRAKVIDFGIAKAISPDLADGTRFTGQHQVLGTLLYMSPEQADGSPDLDTRTDVYSLGVLLYELLVGQPPFSRAELESAGMRKVHLILREVEPKKPSTRISDSHDIKSLAAQRGIEPRRLGPLIRGDLDWIVMKALEKDQPRRYETVNGFWLDLQRHLAGEPVVAAPPSAMYRLRKFVRRHRVGVGVTVLVGAMLLLGIAGTSYGMWQAIEEGRRADTQATKATAAAALAEDEAARAKAAQEREAKARDRAEKITQFVTSALRYGDPNSTGSSSTTVVEAMQRALAQLDAGVFGDDPDTEGNLRGTIGIVLLENGRVPEAEPLFDRALALAREVYPGDSQNTALMLSYCGRVRNQLGRFAEAEPFTREALEMYRRLFPGDGALVANGLSLQASTLQSLGRNQEAELLLREALAMLQRLPPGSESTTTMVMNNLASLLAETGRADEAEPLYRAAYERDRSLFPGDHPRIAIALSNLGAVLRQLGRCDEGVQCLEQGLAVSRRIYGGDHPSLATTINQLAGLEDTRGNRARAEQLYGEALAMIRRSYPGDHPYVATALGNLARVMAEARGAFADAVPLFEEALAMQRRLHPDGHAQVVGAMNNLAYGLNGLERFADTERLLAEAMAMHERLSPGTPPPSNVLFYRATALAELGRGVEAEQLYERFLDGWRQQGSADSGQAVVALRGIANSRSAQGRPRDGLPFAVEALAMMRRLQPGDSAEMSNTFTALGLQHYALGELDRAEPLFEDALAMDRRLFPPGHPEIATGVHNLAGLRQSQGRHAEAEPLLVEELGILRQNVRGYGPRLVETMFALGLARLELGRAAEAEEVFAEAEQMCRRFPAHPLFVQILDLHGRALDELGRCDDGERLIAEALERRRKLYRDDHPDLARGLHSLGLARQGLGRREEAEALIAEALEMCRRLDRADERFTAVYLGSLAQVRQELGRKDEARRDFDASIAMFRRLQPRAASYLARVLWRSGSARLEAGDATVALPELEEALAVAVKALPADHPHLAEYRATLGQCRTRTGR